MIIDFEATCFQSNPPPHFFSEIIEVGGIVVNPKSLTTLREYQTLVKPVLFPQLSEFCMELTSITQADVQQGIAFSAMVDALKAYSQQYQAIFCSLGQYDRNQLFRQCRHFQVDYPFSAEHINLKEAHSQFYQVKRMGMKGALYYHKLPLEGTHHRGIDDARNITKIVKKRISDGWD